jgi:PAS domain S-box-containing protein
MPTKKPSSKEIAAELQRLAERGAEDLNRVELLHEIQVYQEELTAQNEELLHAQTVLEETRDRFIELYDYAPNGYLTLDAHGLVLQINLTGATFLGKARTTIEGMPLLGFVSVPHKPRLLDFLRRCRNSEDGASLEAEITLALPDGAREVQLFCKPRLNAITRRREYLTTLLDITERRRMESERTQAATDRAALASRLITIQDDERHRIARDLHDNIGQQVTALRLKLEGIAITVTAEPTRESLVEAQRMFEELDRQLDFIAAALRPAVLDLGIVPALDQYVRDWGRTFGIIARFHASGIVGVRLPAETETHLYRVAQEALNNVYKHASAKAVSVVLQRKGADVRLIVEDDGRGFEPPPASHVRSDSLTSGFGLSGMRERAQLLGGRIEIESTPGNGTTVMLRVPAAR